MWKEVEHVILAPEGYRSVVFCIFFIFMGFYLTVDRDTIKNKESERSERTTTKRYRIL